MGRAEELFEWFKTAGETAVDQLIAEQRSESLFLDFKLSGDSGAGSKLHADDWKNLAKAISGFGNSEGGIVLWGMECRSDPALGDIPTRKVGVAQPTRFVSWLEGAVSGCTIPAHPGVQHHAIRPGGQTGHVATLIPRSHLAPLQCIKPHGTLQFYMRAGSSFMPVPHAVLAGMFGRVPQPTLSLRPISLPQEGSLPRRDEVRIRLELLLESSGPGLCREVYVGCSLKMLGKKCFSHFFPDEGWLGRQRFENVMHVVSTPDYRLPPESSARPLVVSITFSPPFTSSFEVAVTFGHQNSPVQKWQTRMTPTDFEKVYSQWVGAVFARDAKQTVPDEVFGRLAAKFIELPAEADGKTDT